MNKLLFFIQKKQINKKCILINHIRLLSYIQGQQPEPKIREYFYYIDHEGMVPKLLLNRNEILLVIKVNGETFLLLFLDDAKMKNFTSCFKEIKFLKFFFTRITQNKTNRYREDFPFLSLCGRERNFIRCDDLPIVFTHVFKDSKGGDIVSYAYAAEQLTTLFQPNKIYMNPDSGRIYHPAWPEVGNVGLLRSKMAIELSKYFEFENGEENPPTHITWNGKRLLLNIEWVKETILKKRTA